MNTIAAIAVALKEAQTQEFAAYAQQVLKNAQVMAEEFLQRGYTLVTGGTDNHMVVVDFRDTDYNGSVAEKTLDKIGISTSKSTVPDDPNPPFRPSGLRVGIQAMTTRGVDEDATRTIVDFMDRALRHKDDEEMLASIHAEVQAFCGQYPLPA